MPSLRQWCANPLEALAPIAGCHRLSIDRSRLESTRTSLIEQYRLHVCENDIGVQERYRINLADELLFMN